MAKCPPGGYIGSNELTTQFSCPDKSKYYRELEVYDLASKVESDLAKQDTRVGELQSQALEFQMNSKDILGGKAQSLGLYTKGDSSNPLVKMHKEFALDASLADAEKTANVTEDSIQQLFAAKQERAALGQVIKHNSKLAKMIYYDNQARKSRAIKNQSRVIDINLDSYRQKKTLVHRLSYVIYFLIYAIALGIAVGAGVITVRFLSIALLIGLVVVTIMAMMAGSALKTYGDVSMKIAKGATRDFIDAVAPVTSCPPRCKLNPGYKRKAEQQAQKYRDCDPSTDPDCPYVDRSLMPYDYKVDDPDAAAKFFSGGEFNMEGSDTGKPFTCVWSGDPKLRPSYEPQVVRSSIPCNYYDNRMSA
jgi:hypothetical protein